MAAADVRLLPPAKAFIDDDIVRILTDALENAKAGEFDGLALVAIARDGSSFTSFSKSADRLKLVGALAFVQFRQMRTYDDEP